MASQRAVWERTYRELDPAKAEHEPSPLAGEVVQFLRPGVRLLELGCGAGVDAAFFAGAGATVTATDFSDTALAHARARFPDLPGLTFLRLNMSAPLPFPLAAFDVVYARLSLHYFTDPVTRRVVAEISRVLAPGGLLAFMCKSTNDPLCGRGVELAPAMWELDGKVRHFFSAAYARNLLAVAFDVQRLTTGPENLYGAPSDAVAALATRR